MRIASSQYSSTMNTALQTANTKLSEVMQQMASGKRILKPSDDTIATVRLARLSREEAALDQYRTNIGALRSRLQTSEVTLDSLQQDLQVARDLLVWAADGGNTPEDLQAMAGSLEALRNSLYYTANARDAEGHYLFSGTATNQPTVTLVPGPPDVYGWGGNLGVQQVSVGDKITVDANVTLEGMGGFLTQLDQLVTALKAPTVTAASVRGTVDLTLADLDATMGTVGDRISRLGGRQNMLQTLEDNHGAVSLSNKQAALTLAQLDYGEAAVRMNRYTQAVQATQKSYAQVSQLSLFNAL
ncbi:MAG TPA: flagellar hook-associated protein FlgL [Roseateles sp.]